MITTQDRARAAMQAIGNTVRDAPPLELPPGARDLPDLRDRRWRSKLAPVAAALAVAAVAIALVTIKDVPNGRVASPSPPTTSVGPVGQNVRIPCVPGYYVAWMQADTPYLLVGDTFGGNSKAMIKAPENVYLQGVYGAAANDRTFIVMGNYVHAPDNETLFYLLRIAAGGTSARLTPLPIRGPESVPAGIAISPDGTELAVALAGSPATLRVYSIPTGKVLRTWSATVPGALAVESASAAGGSSQFTAARVLRWSSDGRQLAFAWNATAIRVLAASAPDGNLITSSRQLAAIGTTHTKIGGYSCNASQGWQLLAGGQGVICAGSIRPRLLSTGVASGGTCSPSLRTEIGFLEETSGDPGDVAANLADVESECSAGYPDGAYIGWASADGSAVIGSLVWDGHVRFGLFRDGQFTPLPSLPVSVPVPTGALIGTYDW
jgi:hypothetical protein